MAKIISNRASPVQGNNRINFRTLFHIIAAAQFGYSVYYDFTYVHFQRKSDSLSNPFGGKFKYLTFINAILQTLYYLIALANDMVSMRKVPQKNIPLFQRIQDYIMAAFAFPIAMNVGISFWGLYAINRELVFPVELDAVFPGWLNHVMHTNIVVFAMTEIFTSFRVYPKRGTGILSLTAFMLIYLVWLHIIKFNTGIWVYPILDVLDLPYRIAFFVFILLLTLSLYFLGETMNNIVWCKELKTSNKKIK